jgi:hypothetical protein
VRVAIACAIRPQSPLGAIEVRGSFVFFFVASV